MTGTAERVDRRALSWALVGVSLFVLACGSSKTAKPDGGAGSGAAAGSGGGAGSGGLGGGGGADAAVDVPQDLPLDDSEEDRPADASLNMNADVSAPTDAASHFPPYCGPAIPCCDASLVCYQGFCVPPFDGGAPSPPDAGPACMPNGGLCDKAHKCCSGAPCCGGVCGGFCVGPGARCDDVHPCCLGNCVAGTCGAGYLCDRLSGEACDDTHHCCNDSCINGVCHQPGHADNGWACNLTTSGCGEFDNMTCVSGVCRIVVGCFLPGYACGKPSDCCSGSCINRFCQ